MEVWDPIGVSHAPEAANEYDGYLGPIVERLHDGASPEELASYLSWVRTDRIGLGPDEAADRATADQICEWYATSTRQSAEPPTA
jgi:hypothetical protein